MFVSRGGHARRRRLLRRRTCRDAQRTLVLVGDPRVSLAGSLGLRTLSIKPCIYYSLSINISDEPRGGVVRSCWEVGFATQAQPGPCKEITDRVSVLCRSGQLGGPVPGGAAPGPGGGVALSLILARGCPAGFSASSLILFITDIKTIFRILNMCKGLHFNFKIASRGFTCIVFLPVLSERNSSDRARVKSAWPSPRGCGGLVGNPHSQEDANERVARRRRVLASGGSQCLRGVLT